MMGLRDIIRAIREYPTARAELKVAHLELRQAQQALEKSEQDRESLSLILSEQKDYTDFLSRKAEAFQNTLEEFCPRLSTLEDMKRFYDTISPSMDAQGFTLYRMAKELTGIDVPTCFPYEDNRGMFELMAGHQLLDWLTAVHFQAVEWEIIPNSTYEYATLLEVDTSTPEYRAFEKQLYEKVLERMGFQDLLAPHQEEVIEFAADQKTELKLYCPLSGELEGQELGGAELLAFQNVILRRVEDEHLYLDSKRGLMADFDGLDYVNDKVYSVLPSVEAIDGRLYGVAVCQLKERLSPGELEELKEFCAGQFSYGWGENLRELPIQTNQGELRVSFWQDSGISILTKEELAAEQPPSRSHRHPKQRGNSR